MQSWDYNLRGIRGRINYAVHPSSRADAPVILLIHGHSSSMGEFSADPDPDELDLPVSSLLDELKPHATVIAFDQPCCGDSSDVVLEEVLEAFPKAEDALLPWPCLHFLRDLTINFMFFVRHTHKDLDPDRPVRAAGGSLGGNLSLCLAERHPKLDWLSDAVVWSPGSAWGGDFFQLISSATVFGRAHPDQWRGHKDRFLREVYCLPVVHLFRRLALLTKPQPYYWYSDFFGADDQPLRTLVLRREDGTMACRRSFYPRMTATKARAIQGSYSQVEKRFSADRAAWHWRIAAEQLEFSHRAQLTFLDTNHTGPLTAGLRVNCRLMAGEHDNHEPANLFRYTEELFELTQKHLQAHGNKNAYGEDIQVTWEKITGSGHSLHNEVPRELAVRLTSLDHVA